MAVAKKTPDIPINFPKPIDNNIFKIADRTGTYFPFTKSPYVFLNI